MKTIITSILSLLLWQSVYSQAYPDRHNTSWNEAWISCQSSDSPNEKRDPGHWIMYDLGDQYSLQKSTIWNNNVPGETNRGLNEVIIDYSPNGEDWNELGTYFLEEGPGSSFYQGDEGPDFSGVNARYVLISAITNHGGDCYSLSELRINASISTTTSIAHNELDLNIDISPNPAADVTVLTLDQMPNGNAKYQIVDVKGTLVQQGQISSTRMDINLTNFTSGMYTLTVYNDFGIKTSSFNVISK